MGKSYLIRGTEVIKEYPTWSAFCSDFVSIPEGEYIGWIVGDIEVYRLSSLFDDRDSNWIMVSDLPPEQQALILMLS